MPVEIEAKVKISHPGQVRVCLKRHQGRFLKTGLEVNIFFDTADKNLLKQDKGLRVRSVTNLETGETKTVVTFKGPRAKGKLKTREERELKVENLEDARKVFEALGYVETIRFEKKRESWALGKVQVELDTLPVLGTFLEVEGPSQKLVMDAVKKLGHADGDFLTQSYAAMLAEAVKPDKKGRKVVAFKKQGGGKKR